MVHYHDPSGCDVCKDSRTDDYDSCNSDGEDSGNGDGEVGRDISGGDVEDSKEDEVIGHHRATTKTRDTTTYFPVARARIKPMDMAAYLAVVAILLALSTVLYHLKPPTSQPTVKPCSHYLPTSKQLSEIKNRISDFDCESTTGPFPRHVTLGDTGLELRIDLDNDHGPVSDGHVSVHIYNTRRVSNSDRPVGILVQFGRGWIVTTGGGSVCEWEAVIDAMPSWLRDESELTRRARPSRLPDESESTRWIRLLESYIQIFEDAFHGLNVVIVSVLEVFFWHSSEQRIIIRRITDSHLRMINSVEIFLKRGICLLYFYDVDFCKYDTKPNQVDRFDAILVDDVHYKLPNDFNSNQLDTDGDGDGDDGHDNVPNYSNPNRLDRDEEPQRRPIVVVVVVAALIGFVVGNIVGSLALHLFEPSLEMTNYVRNNIYWILLVLWLLNNADLVVGSAIIGFLIGEVITMYGIWDPGCLLRYRFRYFRT